MQDNMTWEMWISYVFKFVQDFESACGYAPADGADHNLTYLIYRINRERYIVQDLAGHMGVKPSSQRPGLISYFESPEKRVKGIRNRTKPGRFLRKFYPLATDSECELFSDKFKALYVPREYDIIESKRESAFVEAYTGAITDGTSYSGREIEGYEVKSLSGSCMRKDFGSWIHPARAYASGDFTMVYAKEKKTGRIGARVVIGNDSAAPIYTNCNYATKEIASYLKSKEIDPGSNWWGLRLDKIETYPGSNNYLCPYLDGYSGVSDDSDYLTIGGGISFHTQGYVTLREMGYCEECEESVFADDLEETLNGGCVCRSCRNRRFTYSRLMGGYILDCTCVDVEGDVATSDWIDENGYVYCSASDEYRDFNDCIKYDGEYYAKDSSVVYCVEGTYYHEDSQEYQEALAKQEEEERLAALPYETVTTSKGFVWAYQSNGYGGPNVYLEYQEQKETRLRHNYELDSEGIPQRLPELPLN